MAKRSTAAISQKMVDEMRLLELEFQRTHMIEFLITDRHFSRGGAERCVANYLATMRYVLQETGSLPTHTISPSR